MKKIVLGVSLMSLVTACATPYAPIPYDRELAQVESVQIIEAAFPEEVLTRKLATNGQNIASAAGASLGLAGILVSAVAAGVEAGIESSQRKRIQAALATVDFEGEAIFDAVLANALTESEYELGSFSSSRKTTWKFAELSPVEDAQAGTASLDIAGRGYGYQLVSGNTQWRPYVVASVRLTDTANPETILMENMIAYNPVATSDAIVNIPVAGEYAFASIDDIEADPAKAAEGLKVALEASAIAISNLLQ